MTCGLEAQLTVSLMMTSITLVMAFACHLPENESIDHHSPVVHNWLIGSLS